MRVLKLLLNLSLSNFEALILLCSFIFAFMMTNHPLFFLTLQLCINIFFKLLSILF